MLPIKGCLTPTLPALQCFTTRLFGAPKGKTGRIPPLPAPQEEMPISGIVVHCVRESFTGFLSKACSASPSLMPCGHASFHYVVDGNTGQISCLVPENNVAWSFQSYLSNFPLPNALEQYPGWPELQQEFTFPGVGQISADFYTLNIGLTIPNQAETDQECCIGPYGMTEVAYRNLIRLVAYLAHKYSIPLNSAHIAFHDDIVAVQLGCEECPCKDLVCFICDVSQYCEVCSNAGDPTYLPSDSIYWIYGEDEGGCRVKTTLENLIGLINAQNGS